MFHSFKEKVSSKEIPSQFDFPFSYTPKNIAIKAALELQLFLKNELRLNEESDGKMFGVLVVQNLKGEIGYLTAFSGQMNVKPNTYFVPSVFSNTTIERYCKEADIVIKKITKEIEALENNSTFLELKRAEEILKKEYDSWLVQAKKKIKINKKKRSELRFDIQQIKDEQEFKKQNLFLNKQSSFERSQFKTEKQNWINKIDVLEKEITLFQEQINQLKQERKKESNTLQIKLFNNYEFVNKDLKRKTATIIFKDTILGFPPSGAGDCTAPKLIQYAFLNQMKALCMAEFWWGKPAVSEMRKHGKYYPACKGKCEPILNHMLEGLTLEQNPFLKESVRKNIEILYEDDYLVLINKPSGLLSVEGKELKESAELQLKEIYKNYEGPFLVHRLDMGTSGVMIAAKNKTIYKEIQKQFITHKIKKTYRAILCGKLKEQEGTINLPLATDYINRPMQMVCFKKGKKSKTLFKILNNNEVYTEVSLTPVSGRTHQLRVHSAYYKGLNAPIAGDVLYGTPLDRLYLHAYSLQFQHPITKKQIEVIAPIPFRLKD